MANKRFSQFFFLVVSMVLVLALMLPSVVFAEGEAPPEDTSVQELDETPPEEEPLIEETSVEESAASEEAADSTGDEETPEESAGVTSEEGEELSEEELSEGEAPIDESPAEEQTEAEEPLDSEADEVLPLENDTPADDISETVQEMADADLELAGEEGEALEMATEETAEAISSGDPYFTVGTSLYRFLPGAGACFAYTDWVFCADGLANPIQAAFDYISTNGTIPSDRKVYVETGTYNGNVTVDGANPSSGTLNGLIGVDGSALTTINGDIDISNLGGGFTLSGFTINGGINVHDAAGTFTLEDLDVSNPTGVGIQMAGNFGGKVVMENVTSNNNLGGGAVIDNSAGNGTITIKNSRFNHNDDFNPGVATIGLNLTSSKPITLDGVSANHNNGTGLHAMSFTSSLTIKNSVFIGNNVSPYLPGFGNGVYVASSTGTGKVTFENVLVTDHTVNHGIFMSTAGSFQINNTTSIRNNADGINIDNRDGNGTIKMKNVNASENNQNGLDLHSNRSIHLTSVKADWNGYEGAYIDNCSFDGLNCLGKGSITITSSKSEGEVGANTFNNNGYSGLLLYSSGTVSITNILANDNIYSGASVNNYSTSSSTVTTNIKVTDYSQFHNQFINNGRWGLGVDGKGNIKVNRFFANDNGWEGVYLINQLAASKKTVSVSYGEAVLNNYENVEVRSLGNVSVSYVSAGESMTSTGLLIDNDMGTGNITVKGNKSAYCIFNNNADYGMQLDTHGTVKVSYVEAHGNDMDNISITNFGSPKPKSVSVSYAVTTGSVTAYGLQVTATGSVSLKSIISTDNDQYGLYVDNTYGPGNIKLSKIDASHNYSDGIYLRSNGSITANTISANNNTGSGVNIDNCRWSGGECQGSGGVSITASSKNRNEFCSNNVGVSLTSFGSILLSNFDVMNNPGYGINL